MPKINVAEDIIPIGHFKTHASKILRQLHSTRRPMVITQNGLPAAVVLTPQAFEDLSYREFVRSKVQSGLDSLKQGTYSAEDLEAELMADIDEVARGREG